MSDDTLVWPSDGDMSKCRRHARILYGALRAKDLQFIESYLNGDHSDKDIAEMTHVVRTTFPARAHLQNWAHARDVLRSKLEAENFQPKVIEGVMRGLYPENET